MLYPLLFLGSADYIPRISAEDPCCLIQRHPDSIVLWPTKEDPAFLAENLAQDLTSLPTTIIELAQKHHCRLGTAESCTGGLAASLLTDVSGSSAVMQGGVVSYANEVKINVLGVAPADLAAHGAVSCAVASAMALGAARVLGADLTISFSGIAGPQGGSPQKPVGTVAIGHALHGKAQAAMFHFTGDRLPLKKQFAMHGLWQMWQILKGLA